MATTEETLALVDGLAKIMRRRNLDLIDIDPAGAIKMVKSMHEPAAPLLPGEHAADDDELDTWSSGDA